MEADAASWLGCDAWAGWLAAEWLAIGAVGALGLPNWPSLCVVDAWSGYDPRVETGPAPRPAQGTFVTG